MPTLALVRHGRRRSYDVPPPNGEAPKDTAARTLPFFQRAILGDVALGKDVHVVAHGNSDRSPDGAPAARRRGRWWVQRTGRVLTARGTRWRACGR